MPIGMRYSVRGTERAQASLMAFAFDDAKFTEARGLIMEYLRGYQRKVFADEGASAGGRWPGYEVAEPKYGKMKKRLLGNDYPSLLRWGGSDGERLYPSMTQATHPDHVAVLDVGGKTLRFGTQVPYAVNHQLGIGTNMFGEPIQKRPFLVINPQQVAEIRRIIARVTGI